MVAFPRGYNIYPYLIFWALVTAGAGYYLANLNRYISFGIDLVGGTYIMLDVQLAKAHEYATYDKVQSAVQQLKRANKPQPTERKIDGKQARLEFASEEAATQAHAFLITDAELPRVEIDHTQQAVTLTLSSQFVEEINQEAMSNNISALKSRVDQFGVAEASVVRYGHNNIIVELPDVHNPQQAKSMIGRAALLEIKPVEDVAQSEEALRDTYDDELPEDTVVVPGKGKEEGAFLLPRHAELTGSSLKKAEMQLAGQTGTQPVVAITWNEEGSKKFAELTREHIGERLAIVIDGEVVSAPKVSGAIDGGHASISGNFTAESARELAMLLQSGAFSAPVSFVQERHIGPELGQEAINKGLIACGVSLVLLLLFSVAVYKVAGVFAFIVLIYNLILVLLMLGGLRATLTLPGIAGMVLTVGMAIDASILIFERVKEELAQGQTLRKAIDAGFSGATAVILDANITHLLISVVLYQFGTGPIQGFGITMIVGIIATVVTGLWMLRHLLTICTDVLGVNKLPI